MDFDNLSHSAIWILNGADFIESSLQLEPPHRGEVLRAELANRMNIEMRRASERIAGKCNVTLGNKKPTFNGRIAILARSLAVALAAAVYFQGPC